MVHSCAVNQVIPRMLDTSYYVILLVASNGRWKDKESKPVHPYEDVATLVKMQLLLLGFTEC